MSAWPLQVNAWMGMSPQTAQHLRTNEDTMRPTLSYIVWFSQRTGSTLLCKALESTGIAGKPNEWLHDPETFDLFRTIDPPCYEKRADEISEEWVQRFRKERQKGWKTRGW